MIGTQLASYRILGELGHGGMGVVYTAQHSLMGKTAVVKLLRPEFSRSQEAVNRFFNEAKAASLIDHPGIVDIYDFGYAPDGSAYIVMELLPGETLKARRERVGRLPAADAIRIVRQIADALTAAHEKAIIHRDLKPDNVFLVPDREVAGGERAKLLDFGIAKLADPSQSGPVHTQTGQMIGTPTYMSPEQCEGAGSVDHRTDVYSLGCILYELVCGRPPFVAPGVGGMIAAHMTSPVPPPRTIESTVPMALEALIMNLLAKRPEDRPQTMEVVYQQLGALAAHAAAAGGVGVESTLVAYGGGGVGSPTGHGAMPAAPSTAGAPPMATTIGTASGQSSQMAAARPGGSRKIWIALATLALLAGGAVAIVLAVQDGGQASTAVDAGAVATGPTRADAAAGPAAAIDAAAPAAIDAAAPVPVPQASDAAPAPAIDAGRAVVTPDAGAAPDTPALPDSKHDAEYARFKSALRGGDLPKISAAFDDIDKGSPHFAKAKKEHDKAHAQYRTKMLRQAKAIAARGGCNDLIHLARQAAEQSGAVADAIERTPCTPRQPDQPADAGPDRPPPDQPDPPPDTSGDHAKLNAQAEKLIGQGKHGQAIRVLRQALRLAPQNGQYLLNLCRAQRGNGTIPTAARTCRRAIRFGSDSVRQAAERLIREMQLE